ncbi:hypothetical protein HDU89_006313 [Geranomyces variabilis]|nr:hypothetical protein HDU89_006313 [Geranomyces variabilis]
MADLQQQPPAAAGGRPTLAQNRGQLFRNAKQLVYDHPVAMLVLFLVLLNYLDDGQPAVRKSNGNYFAKEWLVRNKLNILSDTVRPDDGVLFPLHLAAYQGDTEKLAKLLSLEKTEPNQKGMNWETPLHVAVKYSKSGAIKLLVASGSEPDRRATTVYPYVAVEGRRRRLRNAQCSPLRLQGGQTDIANLILDQRRPGQGLGQDRDSSLFSVAAGFGWTTDSTAQLRLLRRLFEIDPSIAKTLNKWGPRNEILGNQAGLTQAQFSKALKQPRPGIAPLHALAMLPRNASVMADAIQIMVDHGADVSILTSEGYSALSLLVQRCHLNIAEPRQALNTGGLANDGALLEWRQSKCRRGY